MALPASPSLRGTSLSSLRGCPLSTERDRWSNDLWSAAGEGSPDRGCGWTRLNGDLESGESKSNLPTIPAYPEPSLALESGVATYSWADTGSRPRTVSGRKDGPARLAGASLDYRAD